jgi:hypothetical protein
MHIMTRANVTIINLEITLFFFFFAIHGDMSIKEGVGFGVTA